MSPYLRPSAEVQAALRLRLRHIHLPDRAPLYAPRASATKIRTLLENQITEQREAAASKPLAWDGICASSGTGDRDVAEVTSGTLAREMRSWLQRAAPPPTVLSFTRRPTYVIPKYSLNQKEPWDVQRLCDKLKVDMDFPFPEPPGWSSSPWRSPWEVDKDEKELTHNPLRQSSVPGVIIMPCAVPMFYGPGQLTMWPVMDLLDTTQRGKLFRTRYEFERILEDTTIKVLEREYGINAFSIPGKDGVWVQSNIPSEDEWQVASETPYGRFLPNRQNTRIIATIQADVCRDITRFGISIHVGSPTLHPALRATGKNPWRPLRQHHQTTSIAAELSYIGSVTSSSGPGQDLQMTAEKKSNYVHTFFEETGLLKDVGIKAVPYSSVLVQPGLRKPAPLGLDNRDLSTAWTYEFARQLGLSDGRIDHYSSIRDSPTAGDKDVPSNKRRVGFLTREVQAEDNFSPYQEVAVPVIKLRENKMVTKEIITETLRIQHKDRQLDPAKRRPWAISWPLYHSNLAKVLERSIKASPWDTRYLDFIWFEVQSLRGRRLEMLGQANTSEEQLHNASASAGEDAGDEVAPVSGPHELYSQLVASTKLTQSSLEKESEEPPQTNESASHQGNPSLPDMPLVCDSENYVDVQATMNVWKMLSGRAKAAAAQPEPQFAMAGQGPDRDLTPTLANMREAKRKELLRQQHTVFMERQAKNRAELDQRLYKRVKAREDLSWLVPQTEVLGSEGGTGGAAGRAPGRSTARPPEPRNARGEWKETHFRTIRLDLKYASPKGELEGSGQSS